MTDTAPEWSTSTFGNDDRLPRVPLPTLEQSCERFLQWCSPLLTADDLATTTAAVDEFLRPDSPARALHAELERFDARPDVYSWLDQFWPSRYLGRRDRIALNANFYFLFQDTDQTQVERAAGLISGTLAYKAALDAETVPPVMLRGRPLAMDQNTFLFSTTRIPGADQDTVRTPYSAAEPGPSKARHIVVFFHGTTFRLDVLDTEGQAYSTDDLAAGLAAIMASSAVTDTPVGPLTTKARAEWAASRSALRTNPVNVAALDTIETALFCLALEDLTPADIVSACDQLLAGDSGNRWFDKAVTFIVFADGRAGINVEHCGLDGTTILSFVDAVLGVSNDIRVQQPGTAPHSELVRFELDDELTADARTAREAFEAYAANTATTILSFENFGSSRAKELKVSPDSFVQMAYQLAHQRSKGLIGATYESISTRQFRHGRTEAMRVVTPEVQEFVAVMNRKVEKSHKVAAFRKAADVHVARAKDCQAGRAPEQHLWELQWIQRRNGGTEPLGLFDTPGWNIMRDDYLSTSSAPSVNIQYFGFGMTSENCIGIAYVLLPDRFNLYLSTPRPVGEAMEKFAGKLVEAVAELDDLLATSGNGSNLGVTESSTSSASVTARPS